MGATDNTRIRLMIVCSTLHVGGAEYVAALLAKSLNRQRFDVTVCCLKENGVVGDDIVRAGVALAVVPRTPGKIDYFTSLKLLREVRRRRIDILHTHDVHGMLDAALCRILCRGLKHVHTFHYGNYPRQQPTARRIERFSWRVPDALVAVGHRQAASICAAYGIPPRRLRVIWNGVNRTEANLAPAIRQLVALEKRPIIGSISTLIEQKGLSNLLQAAARLRDAGREFLLLIVGDGHLRKQIAEQITALALSDHVRMLGWVPEASHRALPACDISVQSSLWEAMSMVVIEAMAHGKAMVVTRVGENEHVVRDGHTGLLVPPGDPAALADALDKLLTDESMRARLGAAAYRRHEELFTVNRMIDDYEALYLALAQRDRVRPAK
jgi:glycosyltransferase involved in cell wall biosynthesis